MEGRETPGLNTPGSPLGGLQIKMGEKWMKKQNKVCDYCEEEPPVGKWNGKNVCAECKETLEELANTTARVHPSRIETVDKRW